VGGYQSSGPPQGDFVNTVRAAVVGLGRIGQGYDYDLSDSGAVLTHARAYATHKGYLLVAGTDTDVGQRDRFTAQFEQPAYSDATSMMERHHPDVISICVPMEEHLTIFRQIIPFGPRAVLCEKPMTGVLSEAKEMLRLAEANHCVLAVNYVRRFEPGVLALKEALRRGDAGEIEKGVCWYSKGIVNNGSHFINLLVFLLGDVTEVRILDKGRDRTADDPEPDVRLRFGKTPVYLLAAREECFSVGRIELMGTLAHVLYDDFGSSIRLRKAQGDPLFPGYRVLGPVSEEIATDLARYQWHVADHLYRHLMAGVPLQGDGRSAVETLAIIERIRQSFKEANP
jgi:predicted dehydrogenase